MKPIDLLKRFAGLIENYEDKETIKKLVIKLVTEQLDFTLGGVFEVKGNLALNAVTSSSDIILSAVYGLLGAGFSELEFDLNEPTNIFSIAKNSKKYQLATGVKEFIPGLNYQIGNLEHVLQAIMRLYGIKQLGVFPCFYKGELKSFFVTGHKTAFTDDDIDIINVVSNQLAAYISFADLTNNLKTQASELQKKTEQIELVNKLANQIVSTLEVEDLLQKIVDILPEAMGYKLIMVSLLEEENRILKVKAVTRNSFTQVAIDMLDQDVSTYGLDITALNTQQNISVIAIKTKQTLISTDLKDAFGSMLPEQTIETIQSTLQVSCIAVTPITSRGAVLGSITILFSGKTKEEVIVAEKYFIDTYADVIGVALDNAHSFAEKQLALTQLEEKIGDLEEAYRKEKDMMDILAHELRTPISTARNAFSLLETMLKSAQHPDPEKIASYAKIVRTNLQREIKLLEIMLSSTKVDNNKITLKLAPLDLNPILEQIVLNYQLEANNKGIKLSRELSTTPVTVTADVDRVFEILDNLVGNALKYTIAGSVIIRSALGGEFNSVSVTDTGEGIPANEIPNLGKKFYRINQYIDDGTDNPIKFTRPGGTGLGLYVAFNLAKMMQGSVSVRSEIGKGSEFSLNLPAYSI